LKSTEKSQVWINRELLSATKEDRMFSAIQSIDAGGEIGAVEEDVSGGNNNENSFFSEKRWTTPTDMLSYVHVNMVITDIAEPSASRLPKWSHIAA
jgi:hypothetical protein